MSSIQEGEYRYADEHDTIRHELKSLPKSRLGDEDPYEWEEVLDSTAPKKVRTGNEHDEEEVAEEAVTRFTAKLKKLISTGEFDTHDMYFEVLTYINRNPAGDPSDIASRVRHKLGSLYKESASDIHSMIKSEALTEQSIVEKLL